MMLGMSYLDSEPEILLVCDYNDAEIGSWHGMTMSLAWLGLSICIWHLQLRGVWILDLVGLACCCIYPDCLGGPFRLLDSWG